MAMNIFARARAVVTLLFAERTPRKTARVDRELSMADPLQLFGPEDFPKYNPSELVTRKGLEIFDQMMTDDQIKAAMQFRRHAVVASGWQVESPAGKAADWERSEFVRHVFGRMNCTVDRLLFNVLSGMAFGYSVTEIIYDEITTGPFAGRVGIKAMKTRRPHEFEFKTDEFGNILADGVLQRTNRGGTIPLPREKFALFTNAAEFGSPYGHSELEAAYRPWWISDNSLKWLAMMLERFGVPPIGAFYNPEAYNEQQKLLLKNALTNLQAATSAMIPRANPQNLELWAPELAGQVSSVFIPALEMLDRSKARALLMPGLLGVTPDQIGSHARARVTFDVFMLSVAFTQACLADGVMTEQVIKPLMAINYGDEEEVPTFRFKELTDQAQSELMKTWTDLLTNRAVQPGPDDEAHIRGLMDFPAAADPEDRGPLQPSDITAELLESGVLTVNEIRTAYGLPAMADGEQRLRTTIRGGLRNDKMGRGDEQATDPNAPDDTPASDGPVPPRARVDMAADGEAIADDDEQRPVIDRASLSEAAKRVDFEAIDQRLEARERDLMAMVANMIAIRWTADADTDIEGPASRLDGWRFKLPDQVRAALLRLATRHFGDGRDDCTAEVAKRPGAELRMDAEPNWVPKDAIAWLKAKVGFVVAGLEDDLTAVVQGEIIQGLKIGSPYRQTVQRIQAALAPWIGDRAAAPPLSFPRLETTVRTVATEAYNQGRIVQARRIGSALVPAMEYVAVIDRRTTPVCRHLDGKIFRLDDPELDRYSPPNHFRALPAGTPILTKGGWRPIEDVREGWLVYTHKQRWRPVTEVMGAHELKEEMISLTLAGGKVVNITADHPVLTERGWVCAGDLTTDDLIVTLGGPCLTCGVWCRGSYCSTKCTGEAIKKHRMCRSCGQAIPQKSKKKSKLYCSQACMGSAWRTHSDRHCAHCGTEMISRWKKPISKERRFCSRACYRAFKGETSIEKAVREHLETLPFKFEQEQQFGEYVVDFHLPERSLAIEVDGEYWHGIGGKPADRVQRRADYLAGLGLTVLHIPESAVISGRFTSWIERALDV